SEQLEQWLQADRAQGFDLGQAPLLRLTVHRLAQQRIHLTWSFHHLLLDGWSVSTLLSEVFACSQAYGQGRRLTLPVRRPYRDYIAWLQQQDLPQAEQFWRHWLRGFRRPTPLGVDRPGTSPHGASEDYHYQQVQLSAEMTANLQQLARQQQVTLNTLLQGAWALLLSRYSGQDDVVFGTTVSGRPPTLSGAEAMVGLFINTLPVRVQVSPQQRLLPWLQQLQARQAEARQYEYSPLVQIQGWSEVPRGQSLFETLFVFENYPITTSTAAEQQSPLALENVAVVEWTNYPLTVAVVPHTRMLIRISYVSNRFADETIHRMLNHFQVLLEGMLTTPEQRLGNLSLLTAQERQQLLAAHTPATTITPPSTCLHQIFEQQVDATPDAIAVVYEEKHLTYGELNARANRLAHALQRRGVGPEALVGLCLERSLEMIIAITGILKAGGAYVPLDPASPAERLAFLLYDCQVTVLLSQQDLQQRLPALSMPLLCLDRDWLAISSESTSNLELPLHSDSLAYVIYTSGSTGSPKGVQVCHHHVIRLLACTQPRFHFDRHDVWSLFHSIAFDFSVWELWGALLFGGRLLVVPFWLSRDPERFFQLLDQEQVTVLNQTPSAFRQLVPVATSPVHRDAASALRLIIFGGEALDLPSVRTWFAHSGERHPQLVNMYGITETTVHVTWLPLTQQQVSGDLTSPIGQPLPDLNIYLLDRTGQPVPVGVTGEIYVGGAGVARGYLHRPELTAERFVPHPFSDQPGARLYRSGDLARYTTEGQLEYLGRNDTQVKLRGFRIELGEIEAALHHHPSVQATVAMLREDSPGDVRLVAYVIPHQEHATTSSELRRHLQQRLPDYMVPSSLILLESLPLTSNGKIDRGALPRPDQIQPQHKSAYVAPRTPVEEKLAFIWAQVLRREQIGVYDDFLDLGGSPLLATQLIARIRRTFQVELPLRSVLQTSTIATLAEQIEAAQRAGQITSVPSIKRLARTPLQAERNAR
ncbi:MAG TPA: amino acid adenylation domain-containing protein, partial [Ktedonosporobacter sp.]|nr:amino acid adenylation domain-containing protein [Ktedonosporobacter sp.]